MTVPANRSVRDYGNIVDPSDCPERQLGNLAGTVVKDYISASADTTEEYTENMYGVEIANDGASALTFTVNSMTIAINAGETKSFVFDAFTTKTITSTVAFRAWIKR